MLHAETNATRISMNRRSRASASLAAGEADAAHGIDHIRKELRRLGRMARLMDRGELAHFIDVAGEVASEAAAANGKEASRLLSWGSAASGRSRAG
jgi:hypothetical protein